ncbi:MAG: glutamate synthase subunit alpha, partial [Lachnospiraceae bacterium]|nr:glutamate synthase subunit alpha [Lachnospiraceae bacterium]
VGGLGIAEIDADVTERHDRAFDPLGLPTDTTLDSVGFHSLRSNALAESHLYSPETIVLLQEAVRDNDYGKFKEYTALVDDPQRRHTLRSFLELVPKGAPVPLDEVEPVSEIVKRFKTGAMSYGSISKEAHEALAVAMNTLGGKSNTGEGGEDICRFGTNKNSAIKQVASARFGVTIEYLGSAQEIQIKMAQGAKPGEGGHLPGRKVYPWIAHTRHSTPGVALISPPPHHDIYSIEDLAQLIYDLKNANRRARIAVKLVSESGVGTIASGVAKAGAQVILISGYDGGTGAAPSSSIHHAGLPWELGLTEAHRTLVENGLRERVVLETDGKLMSGRDVAIAALLGAEEFGFATTALVSLGCMMMRVCNKDSCPFGVATQNEVLRKHFKGKPEYIVNFMRFIAEELREIMAGLGFRSLSEMTGRIDCLKQREDAADSRTAGLDLSVLLNISSADVGRAMDESGHAGRFDPEKAYDFHLQDSLDESVLLPAFKATLERAASGKPVQNALKPKAVEVKVSSTNRSFGTIFGSVVSEKCGRVCDDSFIIKARGGGGQSFGAFLPKGVTIRLKGDANDGFGKGLSGGKLVLSPSEETAGGNFDAEKNIIVGNVALYGATSGSCYIDGVAGERFLIRNSGAVAVSLGCGDHGLEYMTGGRAVILGSTGKNFAAGMSGGIAYIYDKKHDLYLKLNKDMVELNEVREKHDIQELKGIIEDFVRETGSKYGRRILENFLNELQFFKKVIPSDYKKMLIAVGQQEETGLSREKAELEAFKLLYA